MAILLQFNTETTYTIGTICENTDIKDELIMQVLQILLKVKLLTTTDDEEALNLQSPISLFTEYKK